MELVINEMKVQVTATDDGRRARAIIATKVGVEWINGKVYRNSSPERIRQELEDSLRRLGTGYIDLYQVHWPDPSVPIEETAWALGKLLKDLTRFGIR
jgi:aryl-alcohol dehydrogenase-like predicted oxidoreductase